jgi:hypothetical protein
LYPDPSVSSKNVKTLILQFCEFLLTCFLQTAVNVPSVSNKKKLEKKLIFVGVLKSTEKKSSIPIRIKKLRIRGTLQK